jgi:spore germination cell wall hydrolase CwlJ-like protein
MKNVFFVIAVMSMLGVNHAPASDRISSSRVVEKKAEILEEHAVATAGNAAPPRTASISPVEIQKVDPAGEAPLDDAITCLARTIYWEAKNEGSAGTEAVANVVMNRLEHKGFPKTICEVVRQGSEQSPCQFSWWCDGRSDDAREEQLYVLSKEIARKALNHQLTDRTHGALYFHREDVSPAWAATYIETAKIGKHLFYKPRDGAAR